jgi:hypothetical protein
MKQIGILTMMAAILAVLLTSGCTSSPEQGDYNIGSYTVTFDGIEEYKYAGQDPSVPNEFKTDSGISYKEYGRAFWKENAKGHMSIAIDDYAVQMYKENQDPREVLKSLIKMNDEKTIEDINISGKPGILTKEKFTWPEGYPGATYFIYYWLDEKTRVSAYFQERQTDKWEDMSKSMMSIKVS